MRPRLDPIAAVVILTASTGCATLVHGTRQTVAVTSDPAGAKVTVLSTARDGTRVVRSTPGVTPIQLNLARRDPAKQAFGAHCIQAPSGMASMPIGSRKRSPG